MTIRIATTNDAPATARVHEQSIRALCSGHYSSPQIKAWAAAITPESHRSLIEHPALVVIVDEDDTDIRGIGVCEPSSGTVNAIYVSPEAGGQGVGAALLKRLEMEIVEAGTQQAHLNATLNAVAFYERHGYGNGRPSVNTLPSGIDLPCVAYDKDLTP